MKTLTSLSFWKVKNLIALQSLHSMRTSWTAVDYLGYRSRDNHDIYNWKWRTWAVFYSIWKKKNHIFPYTGMTYAIYKTHSIPDAILEAESFHASIFLWWNTTVLISQNHSRTQKCALFDRKRGWCLWTSYYLVVKRNEEMQIFTSV